MKCAICKAQATVYLKHSKLKLCDRHFKAYFLNQLRRAVEKYKLLTKGDRVAVAVSGGKDSASLLYALSSLYGDQCHLSALFIDLGINGYSEQAREVAERQCEQVGVKLKVVKLSEYGFTIDEAYRLRRLLRRPVCSICGMAKRYVLNSEALKDGAVKVATGHNLDDGLALILSNYASGNMSPLLKDLPISPSTDSKLVTRIKPLCYVYEYETALFSLKVGLPTLEQRCPYQAGATSIVLKESLRSVEDRLPGFMKGFVKGHVRLARLAASSRDLMLKKELSYCQVCGMPSSSKVCGFCKVKMRISEAKLQC